jgi:SAM-dependent methyltransferase
MHSPSRRAPEPALDAGAAWRWIVEFAASGYQGTDPHAVRFARAKLSGDRVFRHILERGWIPADAHVLDVGCGQGLFASLMRAAGAAHAAGRWPEAWAAPPLRVRVTGIDMLEHDLARARTALGESATFVRADMRRFDYPPCDRAVFLDTLHYIPPAEQDEVLAKARAALRPGGILLLRVHDTGAVVRFHFGQWVDRITMLLHGGGFGRVGGRSLAGWTKRLEALGLRVESRSMNGRPPFANLLIAASLPGASGETRERPAP